MLISPMSTACARRLRNGGQPTRAVAYIDASTAKVRHDADYADMGVSSESCWALSRLDSGAAPAGGARDPRGGEQGRAREALPIWPRSCGRRP